MDTLTRYFVCFTALLGHLLKSINCTRNLLFILFTIAAGQELYSFSCNETNNKRVHYDRMVGDDISGFLFVGYMNGFYKLYLNNIAKDKCTDAKGLDVLPKDYSKVCGEKQLSPDPNCQNHIHALQVVEDNELLICTSNGHAPKIFKFSIELPEVNKLIDDYPFTGKCSFVKERRSTTLYVPMGNPLRVSAIYTAVETSSTSQSAKIHRHLIDTKKGIAEAGSFLDIESIDNWFEYPYFVESFDVNQHVYFLLHEVSNRQDCEDCAAGTRYSRIGRVCKNDKGGNKTRKGIWTSFSKVRMKCPIHKKKFSNNVLRAAVLTTYNNETKFHAAFYRGTDQYSGSAVCTYSLGNVEEVYKKESLTFKKSLGKDPSLYPGFCKGDSKYTDDTVLEYMSKNILLKTELSGDYDKSILNVENIEFTTLAVDRLTVGKSIFTVYFAGTKKGQIYKMVEEQPPNKKTKSDLADVVDVLPDSVVALVFSKKNMCVYASSDSVIKQLQMKKWCEERYTKCEQCVFDPYCKWDDPNLKCGYHNSINEREDMCQIKPRKREYGHGLRYQSSLYVIIGSVITTMFVSTPSHCCISLFSNFVL